MPPETPRFDMDASDRSGARDYLRERAYQALADGFHPAAEDVEPLVAEAGIEWAVRALARSREGVLHQSLYVYAPYRGQRRLLAELRGSATRVVTLPDCHIEAW